MTVDSQPKTPATKISGATLHQISASMDVIHLTCEHLLCHLEQLPPHQMITFIENIQTQLLVLDVMLEQLPQPADKHNDNN